MKIMKKNKEASISFKRSALLAARIRFSPSGASIRNQAVERMIEQSIGSADNSADLTENRIQNVCSLGENKTLLLSSDIRQGLAALVRSGRVVFIKRG